MRTWTLTLTIMLLASAAMAQTPRDRRADLIKQAKAAEKAGDLIATARKQEQIASVEGLDESLKAAALLDAARSWQRMGKSAERLAAMEAVTSLKRCPSKYRVEATESLAAADMREGKSDRAVARFDEALAVKNVTGRDRAALLNAKADVLERSKADANTVETLYRQSVELGSTQGLWQLIRLRKTAGADANELRDLYLRGADDRKLVTSGLAVFDNARTASQRMDLAVAWLQKQTTPTPDRGVLSALVPEASSTRLWFDTAQSVTNAYRRRLIARNGRLELARLKAFADQLVKGGELRALDIGEAEKALAGKVEQAEPFELQGWFAAMLRGRYAEAARIAAAKTREAENDAAYKRWVLAVAAAVRCLDQCYNGRAMDYVRWVNGDKGIETNPIADVLTEKE
jgi:hypothetical protein